MVKKITVSIPDDLYEEIKNWKKDFKASKVFQKCAKREVEKLKRYLEKREGATSMEETLERLRKEKERSLNNVEEEAKNAGLEWSQQAHYDDLIFVYNWSDLLYKVFNSNNPSIDNELDFLSFNLIELKNDENIEGRKLYEYFDGLSSVNRKKGLFIKYWIEAVVDFFEEIKDKI